MVTRKRDGYAVQNACRPARDFRLRSEPTSSTARADSKRGRVSVGRWRDPARGFKSGAIGDRVTTRSMQVHGVTSASPRSPTRSWMRGCADARCASPREGAHAALFLRPPRPRRRLRLAEARGRERRPLAAREALGGGRRRGPSKSSRRTAAPSRAACSRWRAAPTRQPRARTPAIKPDQACQTSAYEPVNERRLEATAVGYRRHGWCVPGALTRRSLERWSVRRCRTSANGK
jgi:hypothetical protein